MQNGLMENSVTVKASRELPEDSGVYVVFSGDSVLYVGKAENLKARWASHHRKLQILFIDANAVIRYVRCPIEELDEREKWLIFELRPSLNGRRITPESVGKQPRRKFRHESLWAVFDSDLFRSIFSPVLK